MSYSCVRGGLIRRDNETVPVGEELLDLSKKDINETVSNQRERLAVKCRRSRTR